MGKITMDYRLIHKSGAKSSSFIREKRGLPALPLRLPNYGNPPNRSWNPGGGTLPLSRGETMDLLYTFFKFIAGGCILVGVTLLAHHIDPRYGAVIATAPIITTIALLFTYSESGFSTTRELALGSFYFVIPTVLFLVALYLLMGRFSFLLSLCGAYGVWIVSLLAINRLIGTL